MAELRVRFRLPTTRQSAEWVSDYSLRAGCLTVGGAVVLKAESRAAIERGVSGALPGAGGVVRVAATEAAEVRLWVDGVEASREEALSAPISRSAWIHAWLALSGSALGFLASWLYVRRAHASGDAWALKMAFHMAAWHLFLTLTLFPASVWGQRVGIRAVQLASLVFFLIHAGIACANLGPSVGGPWIGVLNATSGLAFLATVLWGQRAHRDMEPTA